MSVGTVMEQVKKNEEEMISLLKKLVLINSGSHDIAGVSEVAALIKAELDKLGFQTNLTEYEKAGPILVSEKKAGPGKDIILLGHTDTVFDEDAQQKNPFRIEDGKIYGPGVLDMKGGIVQIIFALKALSSLDIGRNVKIILVGDEETGHPDSNALEIFEREAKNALCVFCCEFGRTDNRIVVERRGVGMLTIVVRGRAAHAGNELGAGRNAIAGLSRLITGIDKLYTDPEADLTASIGLVEGGGAVNVVPDRAKGVFDVRFTSEKALDSFNAYVEEVTRKAHRHDLKIEYSFVKEYPPMVKTDRSERLFQFASGRSEKNGFGKFKSIAVGGGADSAFLSALNIPTLCSFGPAGQNAHTYDEFIYKKDLFERTALLADCIFSIDSSVFS